MTPKIKWVQITPCTAEHEDGPQCERPAPHDGEHWYTVWVDGEIDHPVFWGAV